MSEIDTMPAGRELDALVYERVHNTHVAIDTHGRLWGVDTDREPYPGQGWFYVISESPSTNIKAAWKVFLLMCDRPFSKRRRFFDALQREAALSGGGVAAWPDVLVVLRNRMPEAICRAALAATEATDA